MTPREDHAAAPGDDARSARPADAARRALREARERAAQDTVRPDPSPAGGASPEPAGPADAAREALRRAVSEKRGSGREDTTDTATDDGPDPEGVDTLHAAGAPDSAEAPQDDGAPHNADAPEDTPAAVQPPPQDSEGPLTSPEETSPAATASEPRAADVAREALRAARDDARRAREETEREGARRRRRARQSAVDARAAAARRAGADAPGRGARDVRQLLSDAFRMPSLTDEPSDDQERTAGQETRPTHMTDLPHGPAAPSRQTPDSGHGLAPASPDTPDSGHGSAPASRDTPDSGHDPTAPSPDAPERAGSPGLRPKTPILPVTPTAGTHAVTPTAGTDATVPTAGTDATVPTAGTHATVPATGTNAPDARDPAPAPPGNGRTDQDPAPTPHHDAPLTHATPPRPPTSAPRPRSARSMAAPSRDTDLRRTFPPLPPRDGGPFAESWWGNAWVEALERGALDVKRLERGRGYAGQGHVDAITVTPGLVLAYVQGSRPRPYRVQVRLRTLGDTDWDRFLDAAADRPGHIAALLDKEMPQSLAECGVPLLPGPGDLEPHCSCPDRGHPCKHAAALCYQTARLLDADPFVLLLLRGRGERELLDALSRLSATRAARAAQDRGPAPLPGVRATEVLASRALAPLPAPLPPPAHPEQPPAYPAAPGGPDPFALDQLATDAAARAHTLLGAGRDPVGQLTFWQDAVRLAAARPGVGLTAGTRSLYASLAAATGRTPSDLARAVAAWRQGGPEGLAVLEEPWDPPAGRFDRARPLLLAADLPAFRPWRNHLTHPRGHLQLRLGRDGLWYAYESEPGRDDWWPRGTPDLDPVGALTGLGLPGDL
ncbi:SWIM zinc finger family protein [Streptomyces sp. NPDC007984]|uniref:SWIM zinc finger family protein n=1 Tax=Streptomyces sp. NPDC007984 TaxID=3364801 RepID=UPI0036EA72CD